MVKIALIGYGKMGRAIEQLCKEKEGIEVASIIDPFDKSCFAGINEESLNGIDVAVDFTTPGTVMDNISKIAELKKNIVVGTTGWYDKMDDVKKIVEKNNIGFIWASNFSIGVNLFFKMIRNASQLMNRFEDYDIYGIEMHHNQKKDSPSGTAKTIGDILLKNIERKKRVVTERLDRKIEPDELHIASVRAGTISGTHIVGFDSAVDEIELKHTAKGRIGFAGGAIMAAKWIENKK
ncbi:MAG: 4-hydroxy-tetrahydrodipicolinate reductase, partial [Candidatus Nanohalarchaeota archaeon]